MVAALTRFGITDAFPIQAATIADALEGRDVLGKARTGSGKTLAFGLPTLARLAREEVPRPRRPRAIVIVPTRELAMQVNDALEPYAHALGVSLRLVAGGLSMSKQVQALERGVHLLVATPGRLADLTRRGHADLSDVQITVLDEADHMAQMGFMDEITEILRETPRDGQRLLFSATLDGDVEDLISQWMHSPVLHDVTGGDEPMDMVHVALNVPPHLKYQIATRIANRDGRTIAFVRTKLAADRIAEQMRAAGVLAVALHGDKAQAERTAAITGFRAGQIPVLVATDVAARGIHVDHVDLVLQIDPPLDPKDYTHRSGRTARAGAAGLVVMLVLPHQRKQTDNMFEGTDVDPLFRKVKGDDAESLALVDKLTGASEPSGIPVQAPVIKIDERDWRANRDAGRRSARVAHNGAGRRAPAQGSRPDRPSRGPSSRDLELSKREAELIARERAIAEREGALTERESATQRQGSTQRQDRRPDVRASESRGWDSRANESRSGDARGGDSRGRDSRGGGSRGSDSRSSGSQQSDRYGKKPYPAKGGAGATRGRPTSGKAPYKGSPQTSRDGALDGAHDGSSPYRGGAPSSRSTSSTGKPPYRGGTSDRKGAPQDSRGGRPERSGAAYDSRGDNSNRSGAPSGKAPYKGSAPTGGKAPYKGGAPSGGKPPHKGGKPAKGAGSGKNTGSSKNAKPRKPRSH